MSGELGKAISALYGALRSIPLPVWGQNSLALVLGYLFAGLAEAIYAQGGFSFEEHTVLGYCGLICLIAAGRIMAELVFSHGPFGRS